MTEAGETYGHEAKSAPVEGSSRRMSARRVDFSEDSVFEVEFALLLVDGGGVLHTSCHYHEVLRYKRLLAYQVTLDSLLIYLLKPMFAYKSTELGRSRSRKMKL